MPDSALHPVDLIIGRGLISAETIAQELRRRLAKELTRQRGWIGQNALLEMARDILAEFEPLVARNLAATDLAAWIAGVDRVAKQLPGKTIEAFTNDWGWPPRPPRRFLTSAFDDGEPTVRFPLIERASESLSEKMIVTREQFDKLSTEAKARAFTMANESSVDALETIRDVLAEDIREGTSLRGFRDRLADRLDTSKIGPGHLENVYRTNVQAAFSEGHDDLADNPIVAGLFPYQEYLAIHDARARHEHLELEKLGLNGTGVYRRDDPFWNYFTPPWSWQCRCSVNLLTIEAAARAGVKEAQRWLKTGTPPQNPEHRLQAIPFRPDPTFSRRARVAA